MRQKRLLSGDYEYFVDLQNRAQAYGISKDYFNKNREMFYAAIRDPDAVGDTMVEAFRVEKVGNIDQFIDSYDVVGDPIPFPLNRIDWILKLIVRD